MPELPAGAPAGGTAVPEDMEWLRDAVAEAARAAFAALPDAGPDGDHCGYALYSDAGAMTVCCAANTRAHLARMRDADPAEAAYYEWTPAEWAREDIAVERFEPVCRRLRAVGAAVDAADFPLFRDRVYDACVAALASLVAAGCFGPDASGAAPVVVFAVSDGDGVDPARETGWIRRLNPPERADRFAAWLTSVSQ